MIGDDWQGQVVTDQIHIDRQVQAAPELNSGRPGPEQTATTEEPPATTEEPPATAEEPPYVVSGCGLAGRYDRR
jgi:hypothetical protein